MRFKPVMTVHLALIVACMAFWASGAAAQCFKTTTADGGTRFDYCVGAPSGIGLNAQEMIKYPEISVYRTPAGDVAVSIQSASVNIQAVNESGEGWAGRAGFLVVLPHDDALSLARAINAGETITIKAAHKSSGEAHTVLLSGVFHPIPAKYFSSDAGKKEKAPAPAAPPAPQKAEEKPYPVADLPPGLTSVALIPFEAGKEEEWREEYVRSLSDHKFSDASCDAAAYPYRRAHSYWNRVDGELERLNMRAPYKLTRESAAALCVDESAAAEFRSELLHHPKNTFDRLCEFITSPASYRNSNLGTVYPGACYDLAAIRAKEHDQCIRDYYQQRTGEVGKPDYCNCVADRVTAHFADGTKQYGSRLDDPSGPVKAACRKGAQAQPAAAATKTVTTSPVSSQPAAPKPAPANAEPDTTAEELGEEAVKAINETADKIKKGLGGLFD